MYIKIMVKKKRIMNERLMMIKNWKMVMLRMKNQAMAMIKKQTYCLDFEFSQLHIVVLCSFVFLRKKRKLFWRLIIDKINNNINTLISQLKYERVRKFYKLEHC